MRIRPAISVLLPVRNGGSHLVDAVQSVLRQTFRDFELLLLDDGSTDNAPRDVAEMVNDPRLQLSHLGSIGLVEALNTGVRMSQGEFLARMDADDICRPDRFVKQISFLRSSPEVGVVCSDITEIDSFGVIVGAQSAAWRGNAHLKAGLRYERLIKPVVHPSVMMRRSLVEEVGGYRNYSCSEDHDLWLRLVDRCGFYRIGEPLLQYRINETGVSRSRAREQSVQSAAAVVNSLILEATGCDLYVAHPSLHDDMCRRLESDFSRSVAPLASEFAEARAGLRNGRPAHATIRLAAYAVKSQQLPMPMVINRLRRRIVRNVAINTIEILRSSGAI